MKYVSETDPKYNLYMKKLELYMEGGVFTSTLRRDVNKRREQFKQELQSIKEPNPAKEFQTYYNKLRKGLGESLYELQFITRPDYNTLSDSHSKIKNYMKKLVNPSSLKRKSDITLCFQNMKTEYISLDNEDNEDKMGKVKPENYMIMYIRMFIYMTELFKKGGFQNDTVMIKLICKGLSKIYFELKLIAYYLSIIIDDIVSYLKRIKNHLEKNPKDTIFFNESSLQNMKNIVVPTQFVCTKDNTFINIIHHPITLKKDLSIDAKSILTDIISYINTLYPYIKFLNDEFLNNGNALYNSFLINHKNHKNLITFNFKKITKIFELIRSIYMLTSSATYQIMKLKKNILLYDNNCASTSDKTINKTYNDTYVIGSTPDIKFTTSFSIELYKINISSSMQGGGLKDFIDILNRILSHISTLKLDKELTVDDDDDDDDEDGGGDEDENKGTGNGKGKVKGNGKGKVKGNGKGNGNDIKSSKSSKDRTKLFPRVIWVSSKNSYYILMSQKDGTTYGVIINNYDNLTTDPQNEPYKMNEHIYNSDDPLKISDEMNRLYQYYKKLRCDGQHKYCPNIITIPPLNQIKELPYINIRTGDKLAEYNEDIRSMNKLIYKYDVVVSIESNTQGAPIKKYYLIVEKIIISKDKYSIKGIELTDFTPGVKKDSAYYKGLYATTLTTQVELSNRTYDYVMGAISDNNTAYILTGKDKSEREYITKLKEIKEIRRKDNSSENKSPSSQRNKPGDLTTPPKIYEAYKKILNELSGKYIKINLDTTKINKKMQKIETMTDISNNVYNITYIDTSNNVIPVPLNSAKAYEIKIIDPSINTSSTKSSTETSSTETSSTKTSSTKTSSQKLSKSILTPQQQFNNAQKIKRLNQEALAKQIARATRYPQPPLQQKPPQFISEDTTIKNKITKKFCSPPANIRTITYKNNGFFARLSKDYNPKPMKDNHIGWRRSEIISQATGEDKKTCGYS